MDQIVDQADVLLERLLFVMGKGDVSAAERAELARDLRIMKGLYEQQIGRIGTVESGHETIDTSVNCCRNCSLRKPRCGTARNQLGDRRGRHRLGRDTSHDRS